MSKLIVNTIEAQTYKYDSDTTGMTIAADGKIDFVRTDTYAEATYSSNLWAVTTNGIPDWHSEITVAYHDLSIATTNTDVFFKAYVGGSIIDSGYKYTSWYASNGGTVTTSDRTSTGDEGFAFYGWTDVANRFFGNMVWRRVADNDYVVAGTYYTPTYATYTIGMNGFIDLSGPISGIGFKSSSAFDSGKARVYWR